MSSSAEGSTTSDPLAVAEELKAEGNVFFREREWEQAIASYTSALGHLPPRKTIAKEKKRDTEIEAGVDEDENDQKPVSEPPLTIDKETEEVDEFAKIRAVLHANIGACHVQLSEHKEAVESCSEALLDDPLYVKALHRRAASNEKLGTWSALSAAQEDYNTLLKIGPPTSKSDIERSIRNLKPRLEAAQKKETAEMLDKLKGLGNSFLGNFGLSVDNFKLEPNSQGGYSMNFSQ